MDGVAASLVEHVRAHLMKGRPFYKMSGSGNDFVFFDLGDGEAGGLERPEAVRALCARGAGIGADGVVFLEADAASSLRIRYYNSDGSPGELCGNATLCAVRLAESIGLLRGDELEIGTGAGVIQARMKDGLPEIDMAPVREVTAEWSAIPMIPGESRLGFARAGVPHIVILDDDVSTADIRGRGSVIRRDRSLRDGANVNFVSGSGDGWLIRTYERGVEGETLACGTGAVAAGILLVEWGKAVSPVGLRTRSGKVLEVRLRKESGAWYPSLRGNADLVFSGRIENLDLNSGVARP